MTLFKVGNKVQFRNTERLVAGRILWIEPEKTKDWLYSNARILVEWHEKDNHQGELFQGYFRPEDLVLLEEMMICSCGKPITSINSLCPACYAPLCSDCELAALIEMYGE